MSYNKVTIEVAGTCYTINSTDPQERVLFLGNKLDKAINEILEKAPSASVTAALVLSAMNLLDQLDKNSGNADNMRNQIKQYVDEAAYARMELEEVKEELERLKKDIDGLQYSRG